MALTYIDYLNHIKKDNIRKPKIKIEFLRYNETPYSEITGDIINGGNLNIQNKNGQRRNISFELVNINGTYLPNSDGIWLRQKARLWKGLEINGEEYYIKQGTFVVESLSVFYNGSQQIVKMSMCDKFCLADGTLGGEAEAIRIIPVGTNIYNAVKLVIQPSSDSQKEVLYDYIEPIIHESFSSITTPYTIEKSAGEPIGNILIELAEMVSANVYYNIEGALVFEPDYNDSTKGNLVELKAEDFNLISVNQNFPLDKVYNAVQVIGANVNGQIFDALVENNDLQSSSSIPNVGFRRVLVITDENIYSDVLALARAKYELKRVTNLLIEQQIVCVPLYHIDVDYVLELTAEKLKLDKDRFLINSIDMPLGTSGEMTINCAMTTDLLYNE